MHHWGRGAPADCVAHADALQTCLGPWFAGTLWLKTQANALQTSVSARYYPTTRVLLFRLVVPLELRMYNSRFLADATVAPDS